MKVFCFFHQINRKQRESQRLQELMRTQMRPPRFDSDSEQDELSHEEAELGQQHLTDEEFERLKSCASFLV
jgi:hypothetical protein